MVSKSFFVFCVENVPTTWRGWCFSKVSDYILCSKLRADIPGGRGTSLRRVLIEIVFSLFPPMGAHFQILDFSVILIETRLSLRPFVTWRIHDMCLALYYIRLYIRLLKNEYRHSQTRLSVRLLSSMDVSRQAECVSDLFATAILIWSSQHGRCLLLYQQKQWFGQRRIVKASSNSLATGLQGSANAHKSFDQPFQ